MKNPPLAVRLVGTRSEIEELLAILSGVGVAWRASGHFYPRIGEPNRFSYYLDGVQAPPEAAAGHYQGAKSGQ